jgi:hypothetical protein
LRNDMKPVSHDVIEQAKASARQLLSSAVK